MLADELLERGIGGLCGCVADRAPQRTTTVPAERTPEETALVASASHAGPASPAQVAVDPPQADLSGNLLIIWGGGAGMRVVLLGCLLRSCSSTNGSMQLWIPSESSMA